MDENNQAVLLLSTYFSSPGRGDPTPLTAIEYGRFALWMKNSQFQPKDLFHRFSDIEQSWQDPKGKITFERLKFLLGRGMGMAIALERWQSAGIWVLTRADPEYPARLKKHLGEAAPAVIFGTGEKGLLASGGLSVVGSRKISDAESIFTEKAAKQAALEGLNLVSGGARGVDETAMLAAMEIEGTSLGVLANDLFKSALSGKWRKYIKSGQLTLISPFYPEAGFQVGNAMGRNKYIYCLSDFALVVRAEKEKGGTWAGATENLKKQWIPLFVATPSDASGNAALIEMGARPLEAPQPGTTATENWLCRQLEGLAKQHSAQQSIEDVGPAVPEEQENVISEPAPEEPETIPQAADQAECTIVDIQAEGVEPINTAEPELLTETHFEQPYDAFVQYVSQRIREKGELKFAQLKDLRKDLQEKQARAWLDQAVEAGALQRKGRFLTYTLGQEGTDHPDFFS